MSTPATLKKIEEAKVKAQQRKSIETDKPLSAYSNPKNNNFSTYRNNKKYDFTAVQLGGNQYTSFEPNRQFNTAYNHYNKNNSRGPNFISKSPRLVSYPVVEVPKDFATDDYIVEPKNISLIKIDNHEYKSVEHYYQACKLYSLAGAPYSLQLRGIQESTKVKAAAKRILMSLNIPKEVIESWKAINGFIMLYHAMVHKYVQNLELRKRLLATGDAILAHTYDRDSFYACGLKKEDMEKWAVENQGRIRKKIATMTRENQEIKVESFLPNIMNPINVSSTASTMPTNTVTQSLSGVEPEFRNVQITDNLICF